MVKLRTYCERYDCGDGFYIDVIRQDKICEAWIGHADYGVKSLLYSVYDFSTDEAVRLVTYRLDEFKEQYKEDYMD